MVLAHDIVMLQETHGSVHDLASLRHRFMKHHFFGSFLEAGRGGGLVFIIDPDFAKHYLTDTGAPLTLVTKVPGRLAKVVFPGSDELTRLEVVNIHLEVELAAGEPGFFGARCGFVRSLGQFLAPRDVAHTIVGGDWNCTASDEPRLNPVEGSFTHDRSTVAKLTEAALETFTELHQPHFTRRGTSGGIINNLSRIDRIYSNLPTCELLDRKPRVATIGLITTMTSPSDHVPISVVFEELGRGPPPFPTIPPWIVKHRFFPIAVAQLWRTARHVPASPMARLDIAKDVLHGAAILTKRRAAEVGAETVPEKLHWSLLAFRGLRLGKGGAHLVRRAAAAFVGLAAWLPGGPDHNDPHKLGDLVANLAAESINIEILDTIADGGPPGSKGRTKLSKLHALAATWRSQRRRLALATVIDDDGNPQEDAAAAAELLRRHWAPVFRERQIQAEAALQVMPFTQTVPDNIEWKLDRYQFRELVCRPRDGAPGPDGIPYGAWRRAGLPIMDVLFDAYAAFLGGEALPEGFNNCLLVFIPKGEEIGDRGTVARSPGLTRPISLSNTSSKFFALAVNLPLALAAQSTVHPRQRGFVAGRSITDNVVEIEGFGQSYAIAEAEDPAILLFDIRAAFPSLAHQWLFVVLRRMRVPIFMINCIKELYRDGIAEVVLMGQRWGRFPIRSGIRQGCPASGTLFALAADPCIRFIIHKLTPERGVLTAYADDVAAAVRELFEAIAVLDQAFEVIGRCSALELHPGKVVVIPLWKFVVDDVRAAITAVAPRLAEAKIQDFGKLLGIYIGPGAPPRQWTAVREELRARARFLASLGLAWSGVLPLYRSHVLPVAGHVAQMSPVPRAMVRNEDRCLAVILKAPYRSVPLSLLRSATAFGLSIDVPDIATLGLAATFRAATASHALERLTDEHRRARAARACNLSPFLNAWTRAGVVGHMSDTLSLLNTRFSDPPPEGRGVQRWATSKLRKEFKLEIADLAIARRTSAMVGLPITIEDTGRLRGRLLSMRNSLPPVVLSSMVRSICNAWTTTGRFSGPNSACPFSCGAQSGDKWSHFPGCPSIQRMWRAACPRADCCFNALTLEQAMLLSPHLSPDVCVQIAIWTDVVGHLSNDIRAGSAPAPVNDEAGEGMVHARLRQLAVQCDGAKAVITVIRAAAAAGS